MNWTRWIRQLHRWLSVAFTATVLLNVVALTVGRKQPAAWITYSPLLPLAALMFTGWYLFLLPHAARWRSRGADRASRGQDGEGAP